MPNEYAALNREGLYFPHYSLRAGHLYHWKHWPRNRTPSKFWIFNRNSFTCETFQLNFLTFLQTKGIFHIKVHQRSGQDYWSLFHKNTTSTTFNLIQCHLPFLCKYVQKFTSNLQRVRNCCKINPTPFFFFFFVCLNGTMTWWSSRSFSI